MMTGRLTVVAIGLSLLLAGAAMPMMRPRLGDPLPGLTSTELTRFTQGKAVFSREFTPETGLGPFFNNVSCAQCHEDPVTGGAGAFNEDDVDVERHATAGDQPKTCDELTGFGGPVFREQTTGPNLPPIPADAAVHVGLRSTPMLFGFGLVEAIPESAILAHEPRAGGRAARLPDGRLGRFGRKATDPDLPTFVAGAFNKEQGIDIPDELSPADLDLTVDFIRFLAPPAPLQRDHEGWEVFHQVGCAECHIPSFVTKSPIKVLDRQVVHLFSDLLLHDMGPALADLCKGVAARAEFRTEPLMGLRARSRFLHDGRALTLQSAIVQHGGQGAAAAAAFLNLSRRDREALLRFLKSL
ncbi:MAG: hypothetical protein DME04_16375 [Candidatus Rokuibacteriota bacterium]|nr:MAG: hypothetical protein DME04_16375 [Candidatus Rokubacteria bacterium]